MYGNKISSGIYFKERTVILMFKGDLQVGPFWVWGQEQEQELVQRQMVAQSLEETISFRLHFLALVYNYHVYKYYYINLFCHLVGGHWVKLYLHLHLC